MPSKLLVCCAIALSFAARAQTTSPQNPKVAFTFDDLPAHGPLAPGQARRDVVTSILATLQQEHIPPSYGFVNSYRLDHHPYQIEILKAWHDAGQPLGNHTYSHEELDTMTAEAFARDIAANEPLLRKLDPDGDWHWFRYPYMEQGDTAEKRDGVLAWLHEHGYKVAEVSLNFQDYKWNDAYGRCNSRHDKPAIAALHDSYLAAADQSIAATRELSQKLYGRDLSYVLLLHVGSFDAKMLPELIALFRARGFQFTTLADAESDPAYAADSAAAVKGGGAFLELQARTRGIPIPPESSLLQQVDAVCQ